MEFKLKMVMLSALLPQNMTMRGEIIKNVEQQLVP